MDVSERKWIPGEKKKRVLENVITQLTLWAASYLYTTNHIPVSFFILMCEWILVLMKVKDN